MRSVLAVLFVLVLLRPSAHADSVNYDGGKFAQIPVVTDDGSGSLTWHLLDPVTQKISLFTTKLGRRGDKFIIANWLYKKVTSAGVVSGANSNSNNRMVWTIRTKRISRGGKVSFQTITKFLGRPGEWAIAGGDFNGNGYADALIVKKSGSNWKWGLRADFFRSSYSAALGSQRAYFDFGKNSTDKPFYASPDGDSDWFAVLHPEGNGNYSVILKQAFSKREMRVPVGSIPDPDVVPVPLKQDDGSDVLVFYKTGRNTTRVVVKNLRGKTIAETTIPADGELTVGDYGAGPGEELAVAGNGTFFIYNPTTDRLVTMDGPAGLAADSVNVITVR